MQLTIFRPLFLHRFKQQLWMIRPCIRTLTDNYTSHDQPKTDEEDSVQTISVINDSLMQSIQSCSQVPVLVVPSLVVTVGNEFVLEACRWVV